MPCPLYSLFFRHHPHSGPFELRVFDASGTEVLPATRFAASFDYEMSGLPAGTYVVQVTRIKTGETVQKKIIKL